MKKKHNVIWWGLSLSGVVVIGCILAFHSYIAPLYNNEFRAIVIPHHDMVAETREAFLQEVASVTQPETIILISPDHFNHARKSLVTTDRIWETQNGRIVPNTELIVSSELVIDDGAFKDEHGITSVIGPLKRAFPHARILPILANRRATFKETKLLTERLHKACSNTCLLVASVDFSHSTHRGVASLHDVLSLRALYHNDSILAYKKAEVDSPESLAALIEWGRLSGAKSFSLFEHTNSGVLRKEEVGEMTTHIMGGYRKGVKQDSRSYSFMIAGDTMLGRGAAQKNEDPFRVLGERFFWGVDDALVNLEGVFDRGKDTQARNDGWSRMPPVLAFDPIYASLLRKVHVTLVSHENNHRDDHAEEGRNTTYEILHNVGINTFTRSEVENVSIYIPNDAEISILYIAFDTVRHNVPDFKKIIEKFSRTYRIVAYVHWGGEYEALPNAKQEAIGHDLVDAGADLVIGSHPHVVQDVEVYEGVPILYSIGNFLFDQNQNKETMTGMVLGGVFTKEGLTLYPVPVHTYLLPRPLRRVEGVGVEEVWSSFAQYALDDDTFFFPDHSTQLQDQ